MPERCRVSACTLSIIVSKEIIRQSSHKSVRYRLMDQGEEEERLAEGHMEGYMDVKS